MKKIFLASTLASILLIGCASQKELKFSNTQTWDKNYYDSSYLTEIKFLKNGWSDRLNVPKLELTDEEIKKELTYLEELQSKRTKKDEDQVIVELNSKNFVYHKTTLKEYINLALQDCNEYFKTITDIGPVIFHFKRKFDRVRPSYLNTKLKTSVENPAHAAYPSGHSTHAHFAAHLLSELLPEHRETYFKQAAQIAKNREIAGVHYPSDSYAGKMLAKSVFEEMQQNKDFRAAFKRCNAHKKKFAKLVNGQ